jgi:hypothetical protein
MIPRRLASLGALLLLALVPAAGVCFQDAELADPLPLQRVVVPPERLAEELKRQRDGILVGLTRDEFEAIVRQAAQAKNAVAPRLLEARYRATLADGGPDRPADLALTGTGWWKVSHDGSVPALLDLVPASGSFNLALRNPRFGDRDAVLAMFGATGPSLLIDKTGEQTMSFDWSARAEPRPDGIQVDMRIPSCPVATVELDLPADRTVAAVEDTMIAGPYPSEAGDRRIWRVICSGRTTAQFILRKQTDAPLILSRTRSTQQLDPDGVSATYEIDLEARSSGVRQLLCDYDEALRPIDVTIPGGGSWTIETPAKGPPYLLVQLRQTLVEGTLTIRCLAPLTTTLPGKGPPRPEWKSPGLRVRDSVSRGERLEMTVHPDLAISNWNAGVFRLIGSSPLASAEPGSSRPLRLTLVGGGLAPGSSGDRPTLRLSPFGTEFRAKQLAWWRVHPSGEELRWQVDYDLNQGQLFQLALALPNEWEPAAVDLTATTSVRNWGVRQDHGRRILLVDLQRPLQPLTKPGPLPRLNVQLVPTRPGSLVGRTLPFPESEVLGASFREGVLAIEYDREVVQADVTTQAPPAEPAEADGDAPWGTQRPDFYYPYKGESVAGTLRLRGLSSRLRAQCSSEVFLGSGIAAIESRIVLQAERGSPSSINLELSSVRPDSSLGWPWHVEGGTTTGPRVRTERLVLAEAAGLLAPLAAQNPLQAALLEAAAPRGPRFRLVLDRPLTVGKPLVLIAKQNNLKPEITDEANRKKEHLWHIPLLAVLGASRLDGQVTLHLTGTGLVQADTIGLREVSRPTLPETPPEKNTAGSRPRAWRSYRYHQPGASLVLTVGGGGRPGSRNQPAVGVLGAGCLTTWMGAHGDLHHRFTFRARGWPQRSLPLRLPPGAKLEAVGVDGEWLEELVSRQEMDPEGVVELPVPFTPGGSGPLFEIRYSTTGGPGWFFGRVDAPAPSLPGELTDLRRRWRLPPGWVPVRSSVRRMLQPGAVVGEAMERRAIVDLYRVDPLSFPWTAEDHHFQQQLADAGEGLRADHRKGKWILGSLVEGLAFNYLKGASPLVIDASALRRAGLSPQTGHPMRKDDDVSTPPWTLFGLTAVAGRSAIVLTTREEAGLWREGETVRVPATLEECVAAAVSHDQDASGRFQSPLLWLRSPPSDPSAPRARSTLADGEEAPTRWTEWEEATGGAGIDSLTVVRSNLLTGPGAALGLILTFVTLALPWSASRRFFLLLGWLALAGFALAWAPTALQELAWWPLLVGVVVALAAQAIWALKPSLPPSAGPVAGLLVGLLGVASLMAAAPVTAGRENVVFLVPGLADAEKQKVLVAPELLEKLRDMGKSPFAPTDSVVLLSSNYEGRAAADNIAEFNATFVVYSLTSTPSRLVVPLDGVQIYGDVTLDGVRVLPMPAPGPGFMVKIGSQGRHKLELHFRTTLAASGDERSLKIGLPRLVQNHLTFHLPPDATYPAVMTKHGGQRLSRDRRLEVELGAVTGPVGLRWFQGTNPPRTPRIEFREAYVWELRVDGSSLTAFIPYTISNGMISSLLVDLPPELEVRSAEVRRPLAVRATAETVRLRGWNVAGNGSGRTLSLNFTGPVTGLVDVTLDLVPHAPLGVGALPLPRPHGTVLPGDSYLACKLDGVTVDRSKWVNVTGIPNEEFAPFWPGSSRPRLTPRPDQSQDAQDSAVIFRRGNAPGLQSTLRPAPVRAQVAQEVELQVWPRWADLKATVEVSQATSELSVLQWSLQSPRPLTVVSVTGRDVRRWTQAGDQLLVWVERASTTPLRASKLEIAGWVPLTLSPPGGTNRLEIPCLRPVFASRAVVRLHAHPSEGIAVSAQGLRNLDVVAGTPDVTLLARQPTYSGNLTVRPAPSPTCRILTWAEGRDGKVHFTSVVDCRALGSSREVRIRVRGWDAEEVKVESVNPLKAPVREMSRQHGNRERIWTVELKPGAPVDCHVVVTGTATVEQLANGLALPDVDVPGASAIRWVGIGSGLGVEETTGLTEADPKPIPKNWTEELGKKGVHQVWKVAAADWGLQLQPVEHPSAGGAVDLLLTEQLAAVGEGGHWHHEATLWLRHSSHTELRVSWPATVRVTSVSVDDSAVTPLQPGPKELWLPLPGQPGLREIRLRWQYDAAEESLAQPRLARPQVEGADSGPGLWTLRVPAGWELSPSVPLVAGKANLLPTGYGGGRLATLDAWRAWIELERIKDSKGSTLTAAEERFYQLGRRLEESLDLGGDQGQVIGPDGQTLTTWWHSLRDENLALAKKHPFNKVRQNAETRDGTAASPTNHPTATPVVERPEGGVPVSWLARGSESAPSPRLEPITDRESRSARVSSAQWLLGVLLIASVGLSASLRRTARWLWPEQLAVLAILGWYLAGATLVVLALAGVALAARTTLVGMWVRRLSMKQA